MSEQLCDVIDLLANDHRAILATLRELTETDDVRERRRLTDEVIKVATRHSTLEEIYIFPAVREHVPGGAVITAKELGDHAEMEKFLHRLGRTDPSGAEFARALARLVIEVADHVREEEHYLFPSLADHCESRELLRLGRQLEAGWTDEAAYAVAASDRSRPEPRPAEHHDAGWVDRLRSFLSGGHRR